MLGRNSPKVESDDRHTLKTAGTCNRDGKISRPFNLEVAMSDVKGVLNIVVQLVAMGALGVAAICMVMSAFLLHSLGKQQTSVRSQGAIQQLNLALDGVRSYMRYTVIWLSLGLVFQVINSLISPKISVTYVFKPSALPPQFKSFQPTIAINVDKEQPAINNMRWDEHDKDVITLSFEQLMEHVKELQKADTLGQAQTDQSGP
jgi:hypothetical protein